MNNKGVRTPTVLPWIPGGVDKKDSRNKYVHKKSEGRKRRESDSGPRTK